MRCLLRNTPNNQRKAGAIWGRLHNASWSEAGDPPSSRVTSNALEASVPAGSAGGSVRRPDGCMAPCGDPLWQRCAPGWTCSHFAAHGDPSSAAKRAHTVRGARRRRNVGARYGGRSRGTTVRRRNARHLDLTWAGASAASRWVHHFALIEGCLGAGHVESHEFDRARREGLIALSKVALVDGQARSIPPLGDRAGRRQT